MMTNHVETDLRRIFNKLHTAFYHSPYPSLAQRINALNRLYQLLLKEKDQFVDVVSRDFGNRSRYETLLEIFSILDEIKYVKRRLKKWMRIKKVKVSIWYKFAYAKLMPQPLGVIGIIAAWNGPLNLALSPLIGALAAGNRVMIKTSEKAPLTAERLKKMINQCFSEDEVVIINGDQHVGNEFARLPFDYLLFTGSKKVAHAVMSAASQHLTPVTLELGGKSPVVIAKDADLETAVKRIMIAKLFNAGQVCIAPDYIFLPEGKEQDFIVMSKKVIRESYPNIFENNDYTNIIDENHIQRLQHYLDDAKKMGAQIIPLADENNINCGNKFIPVAILNTQANMLIMQEEIFGPLLPIISYKNIEDVIYYINARNKPLALYYFGRNERETEYIVKNTFSGGVTINDIGLHFCQTSLPFGGVGASGMGHYHGEYGFNTFSKLKPICYQRRWNFIPLFMPPRGKLINFLMRIMLR